MIADLLEKIRKFKAFLGSKVWSLFVGSIVLGGLWFGVELLFIFVLQTFLRALNLVQSEQLFLPDYMPTTLLGSVFFLIFFGVFRAIVFVVKEYVTGITQQAFIREQRRKLFIFCLNNANRISRHEATTMFNERIAQASGLVQQVAGLIHTTTTALLLLFYGAKLAPLELAISLGLLIILMIPLKLIDRKVESYGDGVVNESAKSNKVLLLGLQNFFFLKLYNLLDKETEKGIKTLENYENYYKRYFLVSTIKNSIPVLGGLVIIALVMWISLNHIHTPEMKLLSFFYIFIRIAQSAGALALIVASIKLNTKGFYHLYSWHKMYLEHEASTRTISQSDTDHLENVPNLNLQVKNLHFGYDDKEELFHGLDCDASTGDKLLIRGPSGSGKSTLLTLITGINKPRSGSIEINQHKVGDVRSELQKRLAYVGPEPYLIPGTVRENLMYGNEHLKNITDADIWNALEKSEIASTIKALKYQLDEGLNEQTQLSTGQKQRLALARALLRNPKVFILDEATANLDSDTEKKVIQTLNEVTKDMVTLIISHKDSFDSIATKTVHLGADHG